MREVFVPSTGQSVVLCDNSSDGPCNTLIGSSLERRVLRGLRSSSETYRHDLSMWYAFFRRTSQNPVDAIYSNMGLLDALVDPSIIPPNFAYLAALTRIAQSYLERSGRAHWLSFCGSQATYSTASEQGLNCSICSFPSLGATRESKLWDAYFIDQAGNISGAPKGWMDDLGYLHVRLSAFFLPAGRAWDLARYPTLDTWVASFKIGFHTNYLVLAKHDARRWHVHPMPLNMTRQSIHSQDHIDPMWEDMDFAIGGPNPVHDLFDPSKQPRQEINVSFHNGVPVLLSERKFRFVNDESELYQRLRSELGPIEIGHEVGPPDAKTTSVPSNSREGRKLPESETEPRPSRKGERRFPARVSKKTNRKRKRS